MYAADPEGITKVFVSKAHNQNYFSGNVSLSLYIPEIAYNKSSKMPTGTTKSQLSVTNLEAQCNICTFFLPFRSFLLF